VSTTSIQPTHNLYPAQWHQAGVWCPRLSRRRSDRTPHTCQRLDHPDWGPVYRHAAASRHTAPSTPRSPGETATDTLHPKQSQRGATESGGHHWEGRKPVFSQLRVSLAWGGGFWYDSILSLQQQFPLSLQAQW